jgi:hypothetical protein
MSDPLRDETRPSPPGEADVDRDAKIQELLLTGLDHYFSGQHEQAIHVWTRVLFLDRGHASARAYIERARGALAERLRESEELLHSGEAAFDRGDIDTARQLITSSVDRGGPQDVALALLDRVERLEGASGQADRVSQGQPPRPARARATVAAGPIIARPGRGLFVVLAVLTLLGVALYATQMLDLDALLFESSPAPAASAPAPEAPLPMPTGSQMIVSRARAQFEHGRLHEALLLLDRVQIGDPVKPEADGLRAIVQRELLAASSVDVGAPTSAAGASSSRR